MGEGDGATPMRLGAVHGRGVGKTGVRARGRRPTGRAIPPAGRAEPPNQAGGTEWSGWVLYSRGMVPWLAQPDPGTLPEEELMAVVSVPARVACARSSTATRTTRGRGTLDRDVAPRGGAVGWRDSGLWFPKGTHRNRTGASGYWTKTVCDAMLPHKKGKVLPVVDQKYHLPFHFVQEKLRAEFHRVVLIKGKEVGIVRDKSAPLGKAPSFGLNKRRSSCRR
jgi:hypothetical protein